MDQLLLFMIPAIPAVVIFVIFVRMSLPRGNAVTIEERLSNFVERPASLEELELQQPFYDRVIKPMVAGVARLLGRLTPAAGMEKLRQKLVLAGNPYNMGTTEFTGARIMAAAILGGLTFFGSRLSGTGRHGFTPPCFVWGAVAAGPATDRRFRRAAAGPRP